MLLMKLVYPIVYHIIAWVWLLFRNLWQVNYPISMPNFFFFLAPTPYNCEKNLSSIIHLIKQHSNHRRRGENQSISLPIKYIPVQTKRCTYICCDIIDHIKKERKWWKLKLQLKSESIQVNSQTTLTIFLHHWPLTYPLLPVDILLASLF